MNFGDMADIDNQVTLQEMIDFFAAKNVTDDIVQLVFNEIDIAQKGMISMKDFFLWRDQFDAKKLHTWSHTV